MTLLAQSIRRPTAILTQGKLGKLSLIPDIHSGHLHSDHTCGHFRHEFCNYPLKETGDPYREVDEPSWAKKFEISFT